jgi:hypothetical protein
MSGSDVPPASEPSQPEPAAPEPTPPDAEPTAATGAAEAGPTPVGFAPMGQPGAPASFPEYGAYTPAPVEQPAGPGDPLRGLLAGAGVAVLGAVLWAVVVYLTKYEVGLIAVVIGYGVGFVVHRVSGVASQATAIGAALLAAVGILIGFVLTTVAGVAQELHIGFFDAVNLISDNNLWGRALGDSVTGLDWLFLGIGAFAAWRLVAGQRRPPRRV